MWSLFSRSLDDGQFLVVQSGKEPHIRETRKGRPREGKWPSHRYRVMEWKWSDENLVSRTRAPMLPLQHQPFTIATWRQAQHCAKFQCFCRLTALPGTCLSPWDSWEMPLLGPSDCSSSDVDHTLFLQLPLPFWPWTLGWRWGGGMLCPDSQCWCHSLSKKVSWARLQTAPDLTNTTPHDPETPLLGISACPCPKLETTQMPTDCRMDT